MDGLTMGACAGALVGDRATMGAKVAARNGARVGVWALNGALAGGLNGGDLGDGRTIVKVTWTGVPFVPPPDSPEYGVAVTVCFPYVNCPHLRNLSMDL
jgi:hypothetical protein